MLKNIVFRTKKNNIVIRQANHSDKETMRFMAHLIIKKQHGSPTCAKVDKHLIERVQKGYESLNNKNNVILLACNDDKVIGFTFTRL